MTYTIESVTKELKELSKDNQIPQEYRDWAADGVRYAGNNNNISIYDFPLNLYSYIKENDVMPKKVAELVEGILIQEVNEGNQGAACDLGSYYYLGTIGEQSYSKAMEYYQISADKGNYVALENLGYCYYYGRDCEIDYQKAYECFIKGALTGRVNSLYKIGDMYKNGYYVEKDENLAHKIYSNCIDVINASDEDNNGFNLESKADVYVRYADCFLNGIGCDIDYDYSFYLAQKAEYEFRKKAAKGDSFAKEGIKWAVQIVNQCRKHLDENVGIEEILIS